MCAVHVCSATDIATSLKAVKGYLDQLIRIWVWSGSPLPGNDKQRCETQTRLLRAMPIADVVGAGTAAVWQYTANVNTMSEHSSTFRYSCSCCCCWYVIHTNRLHNLTAYHIRRLSLACSVTAAMLYLYTVAVVLVASIADAARQ